MEQTVILLLTANPDGTAHLRIDREIEAIKKSLRIPRQDFLFEVTHAVKGLGSKFGQRSLLYKQTTDRTILRDVFFR